MSDSDEDILGLDDEASQETSIVFQCSDGLDVQAAAKYFDEKSIIQCALSVDNTADSLTVALKNSTSTTMSKIIQWLEYHEHRRYEPPEYPIKALDMKGLGADKWECSYIMEMDDEEKANVLLTANYLNVNCLFSFMCIYIALFVASKTEEQVREFFDIPRRGTAQWLALSDRERIEYSRVLEL